MKKIIIFTFFTILSAITQANADDNGGNENNQNPIKKFRNETQFQYLKCQLMIKNENLSSKYLGSVNCIRNGKDSAKEKFKLASQQIISNENANKLLKEYMASWLTAIDNLDKKPEDSTADYNRRVSTSYAETEKAWNYFEVEINY